MKYPNHLQVALVLDTPCDCLDLIVRDFARIHEMKTGHGFTVMEEEAGLLTRLAGGGDDLRITMSYHPTPPDPAAFVNAINSPYTGMIFPEAREVILRSSAHILLDISHGTSETLTDVPQVAALYDNLGMARPGATQADFHTRMEALILMSRIALDHVTPAAVHWTQSDQLMKPAMFDEVASHPIPGPLQLHPCLFGPRPVPAPIPGGDAPTGIRSFGAQHWLGREIVVQPTTLPWVASYDAICTFMNVATAPGGYIIPDGDLFEHDGAAEGTFAQSWRVQHRDIGDLPDGLTGAEGSVPVYELIPLRHDEYGFVADEYCQNARIVQDRHFPAEAMPDDQDEKAAFANEIAARRALAEGIGGRFELRQIIDEVVTGEGEPDKVPDASPPAQVIAPTPSMPGLPSVSGRGLRARVFGRKQD